MWALLQCTVVSNCWGKSRWIENWREDWYCEFCQRVLTKERGGGRKKKSLSHETTFVWLNLSHSKYPNIIISIHCWHDANRLNDMLAATKLSHRVLIKQNNFPTLHSPSESEQSARPCDLPQTKWDAAATTELRRGQSIPPRSLNR